MRLSLVFCFMILLFPAWGPELCRAENDIPPILEEWKSWVLHGQEEAACPSAYNDGRVMRCAWPARLKLSIQESEGRFIQEWEAFAPIWAPLPGGGPVWPEAVTVDGENQPVVSRNGEPAVRLEPGKHRIEGQFTWSSPPETIRIPSATGLIDLNILGRETPFPVLDHSGRLWLQKRAEAGTQEDRIEVRVFRLLTDGIPLTVDTRLRLDVSGRAREISLSDVLLEGSLPLRLDSELPVRLGPDNTLMLQVRPGRWTVRIQTRFPGPTDRIGPLTGRYGKEIWAFKPENDLRLVRVEGVPAVDPSQTEAPGEWKSYSTYIMGPEATMNLVTLRRGDPEPAPDRLDLDRTWWLDFDGRGFTIQDRMTGALSRTWRLTMNPPTELGRVAVEGVDQLITREDPEKRPGVQLRRGSLDLTAESRYQADRDLLPAVGWDHDFQSVSGRIHLPPGWKLIAAQGVDLMPGTWIQRWTLLDFFLVLIIAIAAFKIAGWGWGLIALVTLALIYQEPDAPRLVFINLLAATALVRVLPKGWACKLAGLWRLGSIVVLLALAIPFMVHEVRIGVYPQLAQYGRLGGSGAPNTAMDDIMAPREENVQDEESSGYLMRSKSAPSPQIQAKKKGRDKADLALTQDPQALVQTGPGVPDWTWQTMSMKWNGPVDRSQKVSLWLMSPRINLGLAFLRVVFLAVLIFGLIDFKRLWRGLDRRSAAAALILGMVLFSPLPGAARTPIQMQTQNQQENAPLEPPSLSPTVIIQGGGGLYPSKELLEELKNRLLEKPECLPNCVHFSRMELKAQPDFLTIRLEIQALADTAAPLPGQAEVWLPEQVIVDGAPDRALARDDDGVLWLLVDRGVHQVVLTGPVPDQDSFQIPLALRPSKTSFEGKEWIIKGLGPEGQAEAGLELVRQRPGEGQGSSRTPAALPPFLHVTRTINLGLTWTVDTRVRRVTAKGAPVVTSVPLLEGESVTAAGVRVTDGQVQINMGPGQIEVQWNSALKPADLIRLVAAQDRPWTETWILNASPIWNCALAGIPVVHHQDREGVWRPEWRPWPGEEVVVSVTRPQPVPGPTTTIERVSLELTPGERFDKAVLSMNIRTSQGGQHRISLPEGARLQQVEIQGRSQPIDGEKTEVIVPLQPGLQNVEMEWLGPSGPSWMVKAPRVDIGGSAVNADLTINLPSNRWILWAGGPKVGPAVLFWSYLIVAALAAYGLGRMGWTPLKTRHWLLLALGLTQIHPVLALIIVGWLLALDQRSTKPMPEGWFSFDLLQLLLVVWTVVALIGLYMAIEKGLLGIPRMQVAGNGSTDFMLRWTQDRIGAELPRPWALSLHRLVYHGLMLAWALWLALSLIRWLRWGWHAFSRDGLWKKPRLKRGRPKTPAEEFVIE